MHKIQTLIQKGAEIPDARSVTIGEDVDLERLAGKGMVLYPGTRISGANTFIAGGCRIGAEGPVTIDSCRLGPGVELKGGYFKGAVFLKGAVCGLGAHVRQGTILEEQAGIAHTVGLKQTILFPYVTLGSLINFCDCLMAGGTSRKNHSEVGSSYIHFNFTPNQDKATPSLIGDVPRGVMLNQSPIFLGGQGGLVGPCRLAFGTVIAAGTICRNDQLKENHLVLGAKTRSGSIPYAPGGYLGLKRIIRNNFIYLGNLYALRQWYIHVRAKFIGPEMPQPLHQGLCDTVSDCIEERIRQLDRLRQNIVESESSEVQNGFVSNWPEIENDVKQLAHFQGAPELLTPFLQAVDQKRQGSGGSYLDLIGNLDPEHAAAGTRWLQSIVEHLMDTVAGRLPYLAVK